MRSADVDDQGEPNEAQTGDLEHSGHTIGGEDKASKRRQELSLEHPFENGLVCGKDFDAKHKGHGDGERSDSERQQNQVVKRTAHLRNAVLQ